MREIHASEAESHFPELLSAVERGETVVIRRDGRAVARLVPEAELRRAEVDSAVEAIRNLRSRTLKLTVEDILSARDEGRKG